MSVNCKSGTKLGRNVGLSSDDSRYNLCIYQDGSKTETMDHYTWRQNSPAKHLDSVNGWKLMGSILLFFILMKLPIPIYNEKIITAYVVMLFACLFLAVYFFGIKPQTEWYNSPEGQIAYTTWQKSEPPMY